jgi:hypothetical protein
MYMYLFPPPPTRTPVFYLLLFNLVPPKNYSLLGNILEGAFTLCYPQFKRMGQYAVKTGGKSVPLSIAHAPVTLLKSHVVL